MRAIDGRQTTYSFSQAVYAPVVAGPRPQSSSGSAIETRTGASARLWVANPDNDSVGVIDLSTNTLTAEIPVGRRPVSVSYWLNRLQPLPWQQPVLVSLNPNPANAPDPSRVIGSYDYSHPVFDLAAIEAQRRLPALQGVGHTWFCGAWTRYGFHEDGLSSALAVAQGLRQRWQRAQQQTAVREAA